MLGFYMIVLWSHQNHLKLYSLGLTNFIAAFQKSYNQFLPTLNQKKKKKKKTQQQQKNYILSIYPWLPALYQA